MRIKFRRVLDELNEALLKLGDLVIEQFEKSEKVLRTKDSELAKLIIENDDNIDFLKEEMEYKCLKLIATQNPLASDLRRLFTTIKIIQDLERIGDYAVDLAKVSMYIPENENIDSEISDYFSSIIKKMVKEVIQAYVDNNKKKAIEIYESDEAIDDEYTKVFSNTMEKMNSGKITNNIAVQTLFVIKYFERAGDHINNICENIMYLKSGEFFKRRLNK
ncbi:phosphate ABC transporter, regulatory protein PhoU [Candidatus Arthromitus sp. SFB-mouse-Japan]|uniref:phosphate signaling complex protein PhoU n=1 Tax=Candidatus Arthromitus sp. SFB-mouse TaxID=49118 RepID=UPI00021B7D04|nr:phosphate signaling complex protein PhoU [Candidatus Arthromitus sp. SFB-mouse]EIA24094.1 Putative phosphate transporter protein [Candidatus Arthromitus sp. SFB-2]EIA24605.1 Putative phosphate transporter protein [Candidatus Arthromitus sp. SFB-1]EIA27432.1 Putative phosphate transporter protein [Candidatus Arthromitus sp. SFB-co]EIA28431.1 Putative phosphate transporter protein [Candidatus Arthromitus sp. SFB-5]EIA28678.1 Putative phosphate transporter protein [Candidatus Arthromitus sp. S